MASIRSFTNPFLLEEYSESFSKVPNTYGLIGQSGLFQDYPIAQISAVIESTEGNLALIEDVVRGAGRDFVAKDVTRKSYSFMVPSFRLQSSVSPYDIQDKRRFNSADQAEIEADVMLRKMVDLARKFDVTQEYARAQALVAGTSYAPRGTVSYDYFAEFGATRKVIDYALDDTATKILVKSEELVGHMQDNVKTGEMPTGVDVFCSEEFYTALITHVNVTNAYSQYMSIQEPLRQRQGGVTAPFPMFEHGSVRYWQYRGSYPNAAGVAQRIIPAGEAYAVPRGVTGVFRTFYAPAFKMDTVNTVAIPRYMWTYADPHGEGVLIQAESNFLNVITKPEVVVKLTLT